jgi:hypothetical protein
MLMECILNWGQEHGCVEAWVATEVSNQAARRLYASIGGTPDDEPAIVYVYPLAERENPSQPQGDA